VITSIAEDGSVLCSALPASGAFPISDTQEGNSPSIMIRADGRPLISYLSGDLRVYDCADIACTAGQDRQLDLNASVGSRQSSGVIRPDGRPIIAYWDATARSLRVFDCLDPNCDSGLSRELDAAGDLGRFPSIGIGTDGFPIISHWDVDNGLKIFHCETADCTAGTGYLAQGTVQSQGRYSDLQIGASGFPIISFQDSPRDGIGIYTCSVIDCSLGNIHRLDEFSGSGQWTSMALRENGRPLVVYQQFSGSNLRLFDCSNTDCSRTLASDGDLGSYPSIVIRNNELPLISFQVENSPRLAIFDCSDPDCLGGNMRMLAAGGVSTDVQLQDNGLPLIGHQDSSLTPPPVKIFACGNQSCTN